MFYYVEILGGVVESVLSPFCTLKAEVTSIAKMWITATNFKWGLWTLLAPWWQGHRLRKVLVQQLEAVLSTICPPEHLKTFVSKRSVTRTKKQILTTGNYFYKMTISFRYILYDFQHLGQKQGARNNLNKLLLLSWQSYPILHWNLTA